MMKLGYTFQNDKLLKKALTHISLANERGWSFWGTVFCPLLLPDIFTTGSQIWTRDA